MDDFRWCSYKGPEAHRKRVHELLCWADLGWQLVGSESVKIIIKSRSNSILICLGKSELGQNELVTDHNLIRSIFTKF